MSMRHIDSDATAEAHRKIDEEGLSETVGWAIDKLAFAIEDARHYRLIDAHLALEVLSIEGRARPACKRYLAAMGQHDFEAAERALDELRDLFSGD